MAYAAAAVEFVLFSGAVVLVFLGRHDVGSGSNFGSGGYGTTFFMLVPMLAFPAFGGLIASRRSSNPIGWICLAAGFFWFFVFFGEAYRVYGATTNPGALPAPLLIGALGNWVPAVGLLGTFFFLYFPDGRLLSRRWRIAAWLSAISIVLVGAVVMLSPEESAKYPSPLVLHGAAAKAIEPLGSALFIFFGCIVASVVSLVIRYRRSSGDTREQMKWIAMAGIVFAAIYGATIAASLATAGPVGSTAPSPAPVKALQNLAVASFALMPTAAFFAVLRYRLYDIDRVISRTLSYAIITATLAGMYALIALLPTAIIGTGHVPSGLIAGAVLIVAALFRPIRRRVQTAVDHRFNRGRYDAERTLEAFSARLRDQVDIDTLKVDLESLVHRTVQPTHVSLWLRQQADA